MRHCLRCDAEVPDGTKVCPECGGPAVGFERRRPDEPVIDDPRMGRRRAVIIGFFAVLAVVALGHRGSWMHGAWPHLNFSHHREHAAPVAVDAAVLFDAYRQDENAADDKYGGRRLTVIGTFLRINEDDNGNPDLRLKTTNPTKPLGVDVASDSYAVAQALQSGQRVTVDCERVTKGHDEHWLQNCHIDASQAPPAQPAVPGASATTPAAPPAAPNPPA